MVMVQPSNHGQLLYVYIAMRHTCITQIAIVFVDNDALVIINTAKKQHF